MALPIPLLLGAGQGLFQGLAAAGQKKKANQLRPSTFEPPALTEDVNIARTQANASQYPGQDIDTANLRQGVADSFANVKRVATSPGQLLNAASRISGQQQKGLQNIARAGQIFRQGAMDKYRQSLRARAQVQQGNRQQFEAAKSALTGASGQNLYNAITSILGGAAVSDFQKTGKTNQFTPPAFDMSMSGFGFNPNMFSSFNFNPNAFSSGY